MSRRDYNRQCNENRLRVTLSDLLEQALQDDIEPMTVRRIFAEQFKGFTESLKEFPSLAHLVPDEEPEGPCYSANSHPLLDLVKAQKE